MATPNTISTYDPLLKELYEGTKAKVALYEKHPFLAMVPKKKNFTGSRMPLPIVYTPGAGTSHDFTSGQSIAAGLGSKVFDLTRVKGYAFAYIDGEVLEASANDPGAFLRAASAEIDVKMNALTCRVATELYRDGSGSIGARSGALAGNILTLTNAADIVNFYPGQQLKAAATATGALRAGTAAVVDSVDRDLGTVTSTTWGNITSFTAGDLLFPVGDAQNGGTAVAISGLEAWIPATAPGATAFFGVDRTADVTRLGGLRYDGSALGLPIRESLVNAAARCQREGGSPNVVFMNPIDYASLAISLSSDAVYDVLKSTSIPVSFKALVLVTPAGDIKVVSDPNCPQGIAWMLTLDTWVLASMGDVPKLITRGAKGEVLQVYNADQVEARLGFYGQLGCTFPGANVRIVL